MRAVTRWCSRLLAHWFIGYLGFVVDISFFMVGVRKPGKNNLLSLVGIQRASPSSQCWCTQSQMAEMLSRTTLCQCRSPKYPGFQAACQGWRIPPYPTHLIYYCTILVGWYTYNIWVCKIIARSWNQRNYRSIMGKPLDHEKSARWCLPMFKEYLERSWNIFMGLFVSPKVFAACFL